MQYALNLSQRWRAGRPSFAPPAGCVRPADYTIEEISRREAAVLLAAHHYLATTPVAVFCAGMFHKPGLSPARLVGVAVYGMPGSKDAVRRRCGMTADEGLELTRFCLLDEVPFNGETMCIAAANRLLRQTRPKVRAVIACSDPHPRSDAQGHTTFAGHIGTVYRASNAVWCGHGAPRRAYLCADGSMLADRGFSKIRRGRPGAKAAEARITAAGAPARQYGEDPGEWLSRALASPAFRSIQHPGVRVYAMPLVPGARAQIEEAACG